MRIYLTSFINNKKILFLCPNQLRQEVSVWPLQAILHTVVSLLVALINDVSDW